MDWNNYQYFLAVARATSVRAAAAKLGVSHSTLMRKIKELEGSLGTTLFEKEGQRLRLSEAGEEVKQGAQEIEESVQGVARVVTGRDSELAGVVRVTMPEFLAVPETIFELKEFQDTFPNIKLEIDLSYTTADLSRREADIAIRCTNDEPLDLVGRVVGDMSMAAYATRDYVESTRPMNPDSTAKLIGWGSPQTWQPRHDFDHLGVMGFFDSIPIQIEFAKQGAGIASLPCIVADRIPQLIKITPPLSMAKMWVLYHSDLRNLSRVKVVRDFFYRHLEKVFDSSKQTVSAQDD